MQLTQVHFGLRLWTRKIIFNDFHVFKLNHILQCLITCSVCILQYKQKLMKEESSWVIWRSWDKQINTEVLLKQKSHR